jgi:membrane protease YdiL (CAAX protease family)
VDDWQSLLLDLQAYLLVGAVAVAIGAVCIGLAPYVLRRPLPIARLRPGRWTGHEVFMVILATQWGVPFLIDFLLESLGPSLARDDPLTRLRWTVYLSPLNTALALAVITTLLYVGSRTRPHHIGITWARWPANIVAGVVAFLVVAPLCYGILYLVTIGLGLAAREHPFEKLVQQDFPIGGWALLAFMTVVQAPLVEESIFRGVLQGWLRRASLIGHVVMMLLALGLGTLPLLLYASTLLAEKDADKEALRALAPPDALNAIAAAVFCGLLVGGYGLWLWVLWDRSLRDAANIILWRPGPAPAAEPEPDDDAEQDEDDEGDSQDELALRLSGDPAAQPLQHDWARANAQLAVYGSAMLFALAHITWPDPIPLFLLGLVLGWLAYRTQSLIGTMVCHALFNAVACIVLYWSSG